MKMPAIKPANKPAKMMKGAGILVKANKMKVVETIPRFKTEVSMG